jgi:hypothetical protein
VTFLELVQDLWRESGSGGPMPSTVVGQSGEALRLVQWVRRADAAIQALHTDWNFLWAQDSFDTVAGTSLYAFPLDAGTIDEDTFFLDGERALEVCHYLDVKGDPRDTTETKPYRVTILPNRTFRLEGVPDDVYTISYDYFLAPADMALEDGAESPIPASLRKVIVGRALIQYGSYENAPDAVQAGQIMYQEWLTNLESNYLPGKRDMHKQAEGNFFEVTVE